MKPLRISVVIPTFNRGEVLVDTLSALLAMKGYDELIVVDQTDFRDQSVEAKLHAWQTDGKIQVIRHQPPGVVAAMNRGLREAVGEVVLFLDDDIEPRPELLEAHRSALLAHSEAWAMAGRVKQPEGRRQGSEVRGQKAEVRGRGAGIGCCGLRGDLDFDFDSDEPAWITNVMAGNLSVHREKALALGGFDEKFIPPVSFRFETEFAKRVIAAGGKICYEPAAVIHHLRAPRGGTRSIGSHLTSASPLHGVGDYYYALKCGRGLDRMMYMLRRPFREVCTKFHLRHPWWIPVKFTGEIRALVVALRLYAGGRG